jgi:SAM-dependent methyltransferase
MQIVREPSIATVTLEDVGRCLVCSSPEHSEVITARDTLHDLPGEWSVRRCSRCGHGFTSPRPDRGSISSYYPSDYAPFSSPVADPRTSGLRSKVKHRLGPLLDPREVLIPPGGPGDALEVGCGSGRVLADLSRRGWRVRGLEPSPAAAERAAASLGLPVDCGTVEDARYPAEAFDLVVALMVLEHLHDPLADARRLAGWLRPGGFLTGSVPNAASWEFRAFGPEWFALQVPTHLSHFTPASLTRLLVEAGFEPPKIVHQRNVSNLAMQLGRALDRRGWPLSRLFLDFPTSGPPALRMAAWPFAAVLAAIRQAGRISFLARKPR